MTVEDFIARRPRRFRDATFESYNANKKLAQCADQAAEVQAWAEAFKPGARGLFLTGGTGLGKTHLAIAAGAVIAERGHYVQYIDATAHIQSYYRAMNENGVRSEPKDLLRLFSCAIVDEIGAREPNAIVVEQTYLLLNAVWLAEIPVIVTSNLSFKELVKVLGERTTSRLVDLTRRVEFGGQGVTDYRLKRSKGVK